jgi:zinc transporter ZupT
VDVVVLVIAAGATAFATGLGALPVFFMGSRAELLRPILLGTAIGAMTVASVVGLLKPAIEEGGRAEVAVGLVCGSSTAFRRGWRSGPRMRPTSPG